MRIAFIATAVAAVLIAGSPARADADAAQADIIIASAPEVPDASAVFAVAIQDEVARWLDPSHFADSYEGETEMLIAQDLASLRAETTGSVPVTTEAQLAEEVGPSDATDVLP
jgi:hypothetical protein